MRHRQRDNQEKRSLLFRLSINLTKHIMDKHKLLFRKNLSGETLHSMKRFRKAVYALASMIEEFGESSETTLAFRKLQECQFYVNAHLCYVDPDAVMEELIDAD